MAHVRQRHHGSVGIEADLGDRVLRPFGVEANTGKARLGGESRARIDHHHLIAGKLHQLRQDLADMGGADDEHARGRHQRVQKDLAVGRLLQLALAAGEVLADVGVATAVIALEELAPAVVEMGPDHQPAARGARSERTVEQRRPGIFIEALDDTP